MVPCIPTSDDKKSGAARPKPDRATPSTFAHDSHVRLTPRSSHEERSDSTARLVDLADVVFELARAVCVVVVAIRLALRAERSLRRGLVAASDARIGDNDEFETTPRPHRLMLASLYL